MNEIRVMIVEDDDDWRRGLKAYLEQQPDLAVVAQAAAAEEARTAAREAQPDIVLMDIMLVDSLEGIALTADISQSCNARVIMLSSLEEKEVIFEAFQAGAVNYIVKSDFTNIPEAIRQAYADSSPIDAGVAERIREEFRRLQQVEREYEIRKARELITPTEREVLAMIHEGYTQPQIADKFVVSLRTVKNHVNSILKKLNGKSSKEAAQKAKDMGIL
ncbi:MULTISPECIES: response regulator transcription factor [unclassified Paenibacillus]|uniref:response regulator transcription factor n=1 Tax=unclassified Paenibacillus TaxID=185978 RepID=UPI001C122BF3|nr:MULTISPECIES: response regulator transcription factor [unclassified Paenibacillus]MBU5441684.1 response regulator transcription factor [Paenibacillus sp. MSJ-34]CAH0118125.1 Transcriptional regulatory protein LiaR [Paenibacillus sp. CECT 9249]